MSRREILEALAANQFLRIVVSLIVLALCAAYCVRVDAAGMPAAAAHFKHQYTRIVHSEWGLNGPVAALAAQIHQESQWDCRAVSRVGARGCAQFMPTTSTWIGEIDHSLRDGDVFSSAWAFRAQAVYMKWLAERIKASDDCDRLAFALAAYNGGLGYVYRRQKLSKEPGRCFARTCDINPGILEASQRENAQYPRRILLELEALYAREGWGPRSCS